MPKFVAFLRGINVGGKNKIKMAELRDLLSQAGLKHVETYIQSGNVIFNSAKTQKRLQDLIRNSISEKWGFDVPVMVRSARFLGQVINDNPFDEPNPKLLHVAILESKPGKHLAESIEAKQFPDEQFCIKGDAVYLHCPNGVADSKLNSRFFEKQFGMQATARNWNTILALHERCSQ